MGRSAYLARIHGSPLKNLARPCDVRWKRKEGVSCPSVFRNKLTRQSSSSSCLKYVYAYAPSFSARLRVIITDTHNSINVSFQSFQLLLFFPFRHRHRHRQSMGKVESFKQEFAFDERLQESNKIIKKYPDRVPVILERYSKADLPEIEKKKYLVPRDMTVGQFIHMLSSRLHLTPGKALFVFVKNTLPQTASQMDSIYKSYKDDDGFLYMCYSTEKTFG